MQRTFTIIITLFLPFLLAAQVDSLAVKIPEGIRNKML
jgi:hypothetical protein